MGFCICPLLTQLLENVSSFRTDRTAADNYYSTSRLAVTLKADDIHTTTCLSACVCTSIQTMDHLNGAERLPYEERPRNLAGCQTETALSFESCCRRAANTAHKDAHKAHTAESSGQPFDFAQEPRTLAWGWVSPSSPYRSGAGAGAGVDCGCGSMLARGSFRGVEGWR